MNDIFDKGGYLNRIIENFEFRKEQKEMAEFILERLVEGENSLVEAGTGTGKTLAYLLPAIIYSKEYEKKIAVTTETKALQKQLIDKDLPTAKKILNRFMNIDFSYSLCLGSSNYCCVRRFEIAVKRGRILKKDFEKIETLRELFDRKTIFSRFDVYTPNYMWNEINREPDYCNPYKCPFSDKCPYQNAKKEWIKSDILVMNHYLFFTNIATGKTYLPDFDIVIFDEAHSLEDIASSQLGFMLGYNQLLEILDRFYKKRGRNHLIHYIDNTGIKKRSIETVNRIKKEASIFFEKTRALINDQPQLRIREAPGCGSELIDAVKDLVLLMNEAEDFFNHENIKADFDIARGKLFLYSESLSLFISMSNENYVYWIEKNEKEVLGDIYLRGQPVNIAEMMQRDVTTFYESSVFVSATLTVGGNFSFIEKRLGLESHRSAAFESPFDYKSQMILYISSELSNPSSNDYIKTSAEITAKIIEHLRGNCLILFTSYKMLEMVKKTLLELVKYPIYSQGEYTSSEAFKLYVDHHNSVLLGTHSFWQGIDLPGDLLRAVIMMKLPFSVPDSPLIEARIEKLTQEGSNPFLSFQVPEAAIKFKQGFGRLIRRKSDKGIVAVMDSRIHTKSYGKYFLKTIPSCKITNSIDELLELYDFLHK